MMRLADNTMKAIGLTGLIWTTLLASLPQTAAAARVSDIVSTRHNLGNSGPVNATAGTNEVCVFCHTPHGADTGAGAPLWNRQLSSATYATYGADTLDVLDATLGANNNQLPQPAGSSKLCLSCHDGTLAIASGGSILNAPGSGVGSGISNINVLSTNKNLGIDLTNDHPISATYDSGLGDQNRDGEMRDLDTNQQYSNHIGRQADGTFTLPLQSTGSAVSGEPGQVQCTTCHDPHIAGSDVFDSDTPTNTNIKFLRTNRFQTTDPTGSGAAPVAGDIVCVYCHTKGNSADGFDSWKTSAHANPTVADEQYETAHATEREFPDGIRVWEAACLNCHDTHTASGQKKLLRKKASDSASNQENTCYQCHDTGAGILTATTGTVPNVRSEFGKTFRMPVTTANQQTTSSEAHDISNADMIEKDGTTGLDNRHAECTDCHNPHRVVRNSRFNRDGVNDAAASDNDRGTETGNSNPATSEMRTHQTGLNASSDAANDGREGNVASGVLRGAWGVEPQTAGNITAAWDPNNTLLGYDIKQGDPGHSATPESTNKSSTHLTREYQLCFKCHSDAAFGTNAPPLQSGKDRTAPGTTSSNGMITYTNVAAEFSMVKATTPATTGTDQGENNGSGIENQTGLTTNPNWDKPGDEAGKMPANNHRSWHPVMFPTGRTRSERNMGAAAGTINLKDPWVDNIGTQTMQCSDCHGGETSYIAGRGAERDQVQGPHGSDSKFLLKSNEPNLWQGNGELSNGTGLYSSPDNYGFCGNCHQPRDAVNGSGFFGNHLPNSNMGRESCMMCHIAVPHGWKNKAFLVNLLCVGPEGGQGAGCNRVGNNYNKQNIAPYYNGSRLRVSTWRQSGAWDERSCEDDDNEMQGGCPKS